MSVHNLPLFAAMTSPLATAYIHRNVFTNLPPEAHFFTASMVDGGHFVSDNEVCVLKDYIRSECSDLLHLERQGASLIPRLFGCVTSSLKQCAARVLFTLWLRCYVPETLSRDYSSRASPDVVNACLVGSFSAQVTLLTETLDCDTDVSTVNYLDVGSSTGQRTICNQSDVTAAHDDDAADSAMLLQIQRLQCMTLPDVSGFVEQTKLPLDTLECFDVELLRFRLFLYLHQSRVRRCLRDDAGRGDYSDSDSSDDVSENDSDLEYW